MKYVLSIVVAGLMFFSGIADASAQARERTGSQSGRQGAGPRVIISERGEQGNRRTPTARRDRDERADRDVWGDERYRYEDRVRGKAKKGKGPAFCRSGAGHPVHGRSWCLEKGWGLGHAGYDDRRYQDRYGRDVSWGDIIFGRTPRRADERVTLPSRMLEDLLGRSTFARFDAYRQDLGLRGALSGRWLDDRSGRQALRLRADDVPVAVLYDENRDGRVDVIQLLR